MMQIGPNTQIISERSGSLSHRFEQRVFLLPKPADRERRNRQYGLNGATMGDHDVDSGERGEDPAEASSRSK